MALPRDGETSAEQRIEVSHVTSHRHAQIGDLVNAYGCNPRCTSAMHGNT